VICTARSPRCEDCFLVAECTWHSLGRPGLEAGSGRTQKWSGTDRQVRGTVMAALRESAEPIRINGLWPDSKQLARCVESLVADGLARKTKEGRYALP
jgi:A/G-specific adenine glycosylase